MKKWSIWIIITIMALSLCGCRPEAGESAGSEGADTGGGQAEATAQNTEATDTEDEQADGQNTEQTADTADTQTTEENTETQPAENTEQPTENETETATQQTATTTAEDPELRAEADRIRAEEGGLEYELFCIEHDIKAYSNIDLESDFASDRVNVRLKKSASAPGKAAPDFSCVDYESIEEAKYYGTETSDDFAQRFTIILKNKSKQEVLNAIQKLEQLEYVLLVNPEYYLYPC